MNNNVRERLVRSHQANQYERLIKRATNLMA